VWLLRCLALKSLVNGCGFVRRVMQKERTQAGLEGDLDQAKKDNKAATKDLMALGEYVAQLHGRTGWFSESFRNAILLGELKYHSLDRTFGSDC
jgi:hypothetical protein